jgi:ribulose-bisphosphate carboxylase large chain
MPVSQQGDSSYELLRSSPLPSRVFEPLPHELEGAMGSRLQAHYRICGEAATIEDRAFGIALEQSVEVTLAAIHSPAILSEIVGRVDAIADLGDGWFDVRIGLATETVGKDAGQLLNMLFGNSSMYDDVRLVDIDLPDELFAVFGGPRRGAGELRRQAGATSRALTASALKPQGLQAFELAALAFELASGGVDFVKDDHGIADQAYSPFEARIGACAAAARKGSVLGGHPTRYVPSLSGAWPDLDRQIARAREEGIDSVMVAPMIIGLSNFQALRAENPDIAFLAHPAMLGAAGISPLVYSKLFRLLGADAFIFPSYGGRFGYSAAMCSDMAEALRGPWQALAPCLPVPAGGMTLQRVPEILVFYGPEAMLLIGGSLLASPRGTLAAETEKFVRAVAGHDYRSR